MIFELEQNARAYAKENMDYTKHAGRLFDEIKSLVMEGENTDRKTRGIDKRD